MCASPDSRVAPRQTRRDYAVGKIVPMASHLLIANHIYTAGVRTPAIYLERPTLGGLWTPICPKPNIEESLTAMKAWCAFLNSTCGNLLLLNARSKKLTYSTYKPAQISAIPLPDPTKCDLTPLNDAYGDLANAELLPWPRMDGCRVRASLDEAAACVLGLDMNLIADWRARIVVEPTISNREAP